MSTTAIAKTTVLFATSRQQAVKKVGGFPSFTNEALSPVSLICASATVDKLKVDAPARGKIVGMTDLHTGGFSPDEIEAIANSKNDVNLVFVHGAANSFEDAIIRGAYNKAWLSAASEHGLSADFDIIVFTWPSWPYTYWFLPSDLTGYKSDQKRSCGISCALANS